VQAGLLPVKALSRAKGRLAPPFDGSERARVARALLVDALRLCGSVPELRWWVVTDDEEVRALAEASDLAALPDDDGNLNGALAQALRAIERAGASSALVLPADVPLARREDVLDILDTGATSEVVLVPSHNDGGTNALLSSPPTAIEPRFGPGSLAAHVAAAERLALRCSILALPRIALDLDTPQDVDAFLSSEAATGRAADVLRRLREPPLSDTRRSY
jgi:2-phospho-L-lactate guanylyltransferase